MKEISKDYKLHNLNCAHCANKIEDAISLIDGVKEHHLNFINKTLKLKIDENNLENTATKIIKKIQEIEEEVLIEEINKSYFTKKYILENLLCSVCASKIEERILKQEKVEGGSYNITNQILTLSLDKNINLKEFEVKVQNIIDSIEEGVVLKSVDKKNSKKVENNTKEKKEYLIFIISIFLGGLAYFLIETPYLKFFVYLVSYLIAGGDVVLKAFKNLGKKNILDENFLMTIATFGAFGIGEYPEAIGVMIFYKIGEFFQDRAVGNSRKSIEKLMDIRPDYANLLVDGEAQVVEPEFIKVGDTIIVRAGEKVPLDGIVINGSSTLDVSALSGESKPKKVTIGDEILSGSINKNGLLEVEVSKSFYNSTVSKILDLVENASTHKAETEKFITKFAKYYTPIVVLIAITIAIAPSLYFGDFNTWFYRALIFLVISCPCALVVSVPLGFFGGIGRASKKGILIKGSNYLEALNKVDTIIFDKTGTLTKGKFAISEINPMKISKDELLDLVYIAEENSKHPIANSIKEYWELKNNKYDIKAYEEIEGHGVKLYINDELLLVGNAKLLNKYSIKFDEVIDKYGTIIYISKNNEYLGNIIIKDEVKEDTAQALKKLKDRGKKLVMLTGDNKNSAEYVAKELSIDEVYSNLLPQEKVEIYDSVKGRSKNLVAFVGDGINDAPVLAKSDLGISMGGVGSDAAIEASDIVLMKDNLCKIEEAFLIANKTRKIVMQNIIFSLSVKLIIMYFGILGDANMWEAIFADVGVALIAIINSIRALRD